VSQAGKRSAVGDYDLLLGGCISVRLVDATPTDLATVSRQLGSWPRQATDGDPDIVIRFADRLPLAPLTYVDPTHAGYTAEGGFVVLTPAGRRMARTFLPFAQIGHGMRLVCERDNPAVPHLVALVNLVALSKEVLPLHASAFVIDQTGVLVTGWSKGGKTESLLAAMAEGASYVGDEWVYLTDDGTMFGLPEPMRVWSWQFDQFPQLRTARPATQRLRLRGWEAAAVVAEAATRTAFPHAASAVARKAAPMLRRQTCLRVAPGQLFGADKMLPRAHMDAVVLVASHDSPLITVTAAGSGEVTRRMAASLTEERAALSSEYHRFRYACPDQRSWVLEGAADTERRLLSALFDRRPAVSVTHPYPCDLRKLGRSVVAAAHEMAARDAEVAR